MLSNAERDALALLRSGGSYADAAAMSHLSVDHVIALWAAHGQVTWDVSHQGERADDR